MCIIIIIIIDDEMMMSHNCYNKICTSVLQTVVFEVVRTPSSPQALSSTILRTLKGKCLCADEEGGIPSLIFGTFS